VPAVEIRAPEPVRDTAPADAFGAVLKDSIARVENLRAGAGETVDRLLAGEGEDLHTAALATQRAELAFELFLQVRNKAVQAYQEIMRMQI